MTVLRTQAVLEPGLRRRVVESYVTAPIFWVPALLISAILAWIIVDATQAGPVGSLAALCVAVLIGFGTVAAAAFWKLVGDHGTWWVLGDARAGAVLLAKDCGEASVNIDMHAAWPKRAVSRGGMGFGGVLRQRFAREVQARGRQVTAKATFCLLRKYERDGLHRMRWVVSGACMASAPKSLSSRHVAVISVAPLSAEGPAWVGTTAEFCGRYLNGDCSDAKAAVDWARSAQLAVTFYRHRSQVVRRRPTRLGALSLRPIRGG